MPAQVRSFEAIARVRDAVAAFAHHGGEGLDELAGEIRRVIDWVEHDRPAYWKERTRRAYDAVNEAKSALHRCLMYPVGDENPSCADERAALKRAQAHLALCEEKRVRVREWAHQLRHELHEYQGRTSVLRRLVDEDARRCVALLDRALTSLERYTQASAPPGSIENAADDRADAASGADPPETDP